MHLQIGEEEYRQYESSKETAGTQAEFDKLPQQWLSSKEDEPI